MQEQRELEPGDGGTRGHGAGGQAPARETRAIVPREHGGACPSLTERTKTAYSSVASTRGAVRLTEGTPNSSVTRLDQAERT
jgi:hypothetical protein